MDCRGAACRDGTRSYIHCIRSSGAFSIRTTIMRNHQSFTLVLSALALAAGLACAEVPTDKQLAALLEQVRQKHDLPALAAAVVNKQGVVAIAAVGVRKRGDRTPVTINDQFHLGSDTKAMTAVLLALYVENGDLKWTDTLGQLFPRAAESMSPEVRKITVEQLLTHHAGLAHDLAGGWESVSRQLSLREQRQAVLKCIASAKLEHVPGEKFEYSNLGYTLAGHVAEKLGKADWEELMTKKLFEPLGMKTAGFGPMGTRGRIDQPWQHRKDGTPINPGPNSDNPPVMGPAGRVHASLGDWARFIAFWMRAGKGEPALLKPETFEQLNSTPFKDTDYLRGGWGGHHNNKRAEGLVLSHDGSNTKNYCTAWLAPARGFAVLVATNQGGEEAKKACVEVRRLLVEKYLEGK